MSIFELDRRNSALVDNGSRVKDVVIGLVSEREFARAQAEIVDLANYVDYDDWLDAREGQQIGLAMAGVDAAKVCVSLSSFLQWRGLTEASCDERRARRVRQPGVGDAKGVRVECAGGRQRI